ncbi:hypothetical protein IU486_03985 [Streptomyces gardneri]|uniref:hypothetical protein n=1 Tax=Nocardia TaxID=1817 RepID=UPI00135AB588|nr:MULTISPECIES: hypothetical protein [Nocardia]MBF6163933.1 hypothetical protein [Streptomyces gardneri]MBF6203509.1 hypothetical protein [Streptomyces gardneri]UAK33574.1 hypothetical protein K8O92_06410 [Nocardia asteroides]
MITTPLFRLGLPALVLAATACLMTDATAAAQALPTYTCKYTLDEPHFGSVKGRECTSSGGAPLGGWHMITFQMENSATGEKWVCGTVEAALIPYYLDKVDPDYSDIERAYGRGADASVCDRLLN